MSTAATAGLRAAGATDVGRVRRANEDRFIVDPAHGVFAVVDGVGGHAAGDRAADTAIAILGRRLTDGATAPGRQMRDAIIEANNEIHRLAATRPEWHGMACVLTAVVVRGHRAVVGHVGDSRLYTLVGGRLEKITPDHSPVGAREDARELTEFEAMRHPRRNEVYRDVGSERHEAADPDYAFVAEMDVPAGAALLLCSDGLTDLVPSETIRQIALTHQGAPDEVARALVAAANEAGGRDNVTVVYVEQAARPAPAPARRGRSSLVLAALVSGLAGLAVGYLGPGGGWSPGRGGTSLPSASASAVVVRPTESIAAAVERASAGMTVVVEPGEYRERLTLKDHVRVMSRIPRGATLRLPGSLTEQDAAVVAAGVVNAELSGFRIVGDAATPLGVGVVTRDASVRLVDLEITGASTSAVDLGPGDSVAMAASEIHHNPGSAIVIRSGGTPGLTNNVFAANATSDRRPAAFVIEPGATPVWRHNVFDGMAASVIPGLDAPARADIARTNWFTAPPPPASAPRPAGRRGGRAQ